MAVLPDADRARIARAVMRGAVLQIPGIPNVTKPDLRAAINATDDWIDSNQAAFNTALPTAFKNNATTAQKTLLFCAVALMRVSQTALEAVFGGSD